MAEFKVVMKQYNRLCNEFRSGLHVKYCDECPVSSVKNGKNLTCTEVVRSDPEWFEKIVMDWAAKNPEPRYPSWNEAWKQAFPNGGLVPCPMHFDARCKPDDCSSCSACKERPISADIAEKLGVKPIGGAEDEKA